jgi:hypothetical protein
MIVPTPNSPSHERTSISTRWQARARAASYTPTTSTVGTHTSSRLARPPGQRDWMIGAAGDDGRASGCRPVDAAAIGTSARSSAPADRSPGRRESRHTASDDKGAIVKFAHSWVLSPVGAGTATLAGVNWVQRVNLVVGTLGLVLLVASVIEGRWLVVLTMVLVVPAQAITFLGERRRSRGQR